MNTHADKTTDAKSNAAANGVAVQQGAEHEGTLQLEDNRPETIAQRQIQDAANNSPQVTQLKAIQAMANSSTQVKQLRAVQAMANDSTYNPNQFKAINESDGKLLNHHAGLMQAAATISAARPVAQLEVYERGQFRESEPEVTEDHNTFHALNVWEMLQKGMDMFAAAAGDIINKIKAVPNMVLTLSTSTEIDSIGMTTLKLTDPTGKVRTTEGGKANSATIAEWSKWLTNPKTRIGVLVQVNPNRLGNAAEVAHTLNHEVFLHAVNIFNEMNDLKTTEGDGPRLQKALTSVNRPDKDHEDLVFGRREALLENQSRMINDAIEGKYAHKKPEPEIAEQLIADYERDWTEERQNLLKRMAGQLWTTEHDLKIYATQLIKHFEGIDDARQEVSDMKKILKIIDYTFARHLDDVWNKYEINLSSPITPPEEAEKKEKDEGKNDK